jgi:hypothetical protein
MVKKDQKQIPASLQPWIDARRRFHLSHEHVQMARELGMNPKKLGKLDNHGQEPWKLPLPEFIRKLYSKRFGKERPDAVRSIEDMVVAKQAKKQSNKAARDSRTLDGWLGRAARRSPHTRPSAPDPPAPRRRATGSAENPHRPEKIGITVRPACAGPLPRARQPPPGRAAPRWPWPQTPVAAEAPHRPRPR